MRTSDLFDVVEGFVGSLSDAESIFQAIADTLPGSEEFVLRRYLGMDIPEGLSSQYENMTDREYEEALEAVKEKACRAIPTLPDR